jgi:hypothetical protein
MMQKPPKNPNSPRPSNLSGDSARPRLRLIKTEQPDRAPTASAQSQSSDAKDAPKSALARFMTSYADELDRQIQVILDS